MFAGKGGGERERGYSESAEFVNEKGGNERAKQARFSNREANSFRRNEGKEGRGRNGRILIKKKERKGDFRHLYEW